MKGSKLNPKFVVNFLSLLLISRLPNQRWTNKFPVRLLHVYIPLITLLTQVSSRFARSLRPILQSVKLKQVSYRLTSGQGRVESS